MPSQPPSRAALLQAQAWAGAADLIDRQLSPLGLRAIEALAPQTGDTILDIGCGAGDTCVQLAGRVGARGRVVGVDIAPLLLDIARRRAEALPQAQFVEGDARGLDWPDESVDGVFSRFGVMAFDDPAAAFANFRRTLKPSGRLAFVCWRSLEENELDYLPLQAAGLEAMAAATPFRFADPSVVRALLETAGFVEIDIRARDEPVSSGGVDETAAVLLKVGSLGKIVRENPELRSEVEARLREALGARLYDGSVVLNAAVWIVSARRA